MIGWLKRDSDKKLLLKYFLKLMIGYAYGGGFTKGILVIEYRGSKEGKLERKNKVVRSDCKSN